MAQLKGEIAPLFTAPISLDLRDKKIIQYMLVNPRVKLRLIAKDLRISKSAVSRRIDSLRTQGVLIEPIVISDFQEYGVSRYAIFMVVDKQPPSEVVSQLSSLPFVSAVMSSLGRYQFGVYIDVTPLKPLKWHLSRLNNVLMPRQMEVLRVGAIELQPYNLFDVSIDYGYRPAHKRFGIKPEDVKILSGIQRDPVISSLTLAKNLGMNQKTVFNRMKLWLDSGHLHLFHNINIFGLGFIPFLFILTFDESHRLRIKALVKSCRFINNVFDTKKGMLSVGVFDSFASLYAFMKSIEDKAGDAIFTFEHLLLVHQHYNNFLPPMVIDYLKTVAKKQS